jgi:alanine racemase
VIKANGYGHGAVELARTLSDEADAFAVACSEEAMELRESGIRDPIVLLGGAFEPGEVTGAALHGLTLTLHTETQLEWLLAARPPRPLSVWLKIDTGMHRLGFAPEELARVHAQLAACRHVERIVLMSHFACADETGNGATARQLACFRAAAAEIEAPVSLANSAAVMAWPDTHGDWIRPGIMLYGSSPFGAGSDAAGLRPVMRLESRLVAVHQLEAGEAIGYGARYVCDRPTRVGVVAIGYADGYPRHAPDGTPVAVNDQLTRLIGRVSMDMLTVDLTALPDARVGDHVQLWGDRVSANEVARLSETIAYELFTGVGHRVHFRYL